MKKLIFIFLCSLFTFNIYSNTVEIPNEKIFENPKKEVTTIESKKKKEHAEMNIKVNKFDVQNILGHKTDDGKIQYFIPKEKKNNVLKTLVNNGSNEYLIFKTKDELINHLNKNKKKRSTVQTINYEIMSDKEFDMLTVNTNEDVYILNNNNDIFRGEFASRATTYAQDVSITLDRNYVNYMFARNTRYELGMLKNLNNIIGFFSTRGNYETGNNLNFWLNNGYGSNSLSVIQDPGTNYNIVLGNTPGLTTDQRILGLEYVSGNSFPMNYLSVVLNRTDKYKAMNGESIWKTKIAFREFSHLRSLELASTIYARGNWTGSSSVMMSGHRIKINFTDWSNNRDNPNRASITTTIMPGDKNTENKFIYANNSSISDGVAIKSPNMNITINRNIFMGPFSGNSYEVFSTIKNSGYYQGAKAVLPYNDYISEMKIVGDNYYYPMVKLKKKYIERGEIINGYAYAIVPWGNYDFLYYRFSINQNVEELGRVGLYVDSRIKRAKSNKGNNLYVNTFTGGITNNIGGNDTFKGEYLELVHYDNTQLNNKPSDLRTPIFEEVINKPYLVLNGGNGMKVYSATNSINSNDKVVIGDELPIAFFDVALSTVAIGPNDDVIDSNNILYYRLKGSNNFLKVKQYIYLSEDFYYDDGKGSIDLSKVRINEPVEWDMFEFDASIYSINSSTHNSIMLNMLKGHLPLLISPMNNPYHIVSDMELYENNVLIDTTENKLDVTVSSDYNKFEINDTSLKVSKLKYSETPKTYKIIFYYLDVPLGAMEFTITNSDPIRALPSKKFIIDDRLLRSSISDTVLKNSGDRYKVSGTSLQLLGNYNDFFKVEGTIGTQNTEKIIDIEAPNKSTAGTLGEYIKYSSSTTDTSIFPTFTNNNLLISGLDSKMAIYLNQSRQNRTHSFKVFTDFARLNTLDIIEEYRNTGYFEGAGVIDLSSLNAQVEAKWGTNNAGNKGALQSLTNNAILNISSGNFFNLKSIFTNKVLATKLVVKRNSSNPVEVTGEINQKKEITTEDNVIGIDENGAFYIKKKSGNIANNVHYDIEVYYKDICLGKLSLNVKHSSSGLILEGIDAFDFGVLTKGISQSLEGKFIIKGTPGGNLNLISIDIPQTANMTITTPNMNDKIPIEIRSSHQKIGNEINGIINVKANVPQTANPGNYAGEINLIVNVQ